MNDLSDEQLLKRYLQSGDQNAFGLLVTRHINAIYAAAKRQVRDPHLAQDVTQAVFIVMARRARTIRQHSSLPGWLLKVTWFASRDALRSQARRRRNERQVDAMKQTQPHNSAEQARVWREIAPVLDDALARLNDADRTAIMLRYLEDKPIIDVARSLSTTEAAATKRISRALPKLRRLLSRRGVTIPATILAAILAANAAEAAPAASSAAVVKAALLGSKMSLAAGTASGSPALVKGTLMAMTMTQIKATAVAAAIIALAIPATITVFHYAPSSSTRGASPVGVEASPSAIQLAAAPAASLPASTPLYALAEGQVLKYIVDPPEEARLENWKRLTMKTDVVVRSGGTPQPPPALHRTASVPAPLMVAFKKDGSWTYRTQSPDTLFMLSDLVESFLHVYPQEMEGNDFFIQGDFIWREEAAPEERRVALEKMIRDDLHEPLVLTFRNVPQKVIVLKGQWKYTAPAESKHAKSVDFGKLPVIELFVNNINEQLDGGSVGDVVSSAGKLGKAINKQVIIEAQGFPQAVALAFNDPHERMTGNPTPVLDHVAAQTGLTWSEETRTVRRLFVEEKK